eukprot:TRINITY_DN1903_c0_g1_i3.p2 TRINITY_DN1903_c0_g1~~TRINITY_DN1903_c0_g1_i3.p2  ORF type:complete len:100 (+),score=15.80 TRINITY_DN1903_c0_g1_i3:374-673(+)
MIPQIALLQSESRVPTWWSTLMIESASTTTDEKELQLRVEENEVLKIDRALRFNGKNDFVHIPDFQGLPRQQITVAAWSKIRRHRNWNRIVSHNWITNG